MFCLNGSTDFILAIQDHDVVVALKFDRFAGAQVEELEESLMYLPEVASCGARGAERTRFRHGFSRDSKLDLLSRTCTVQPDYTSMDDIMGIHVLQSRSFGGCEEASLLARPTRSAPF